MHGGRVAAALAAAAAAARAQPDPNCTRGILSPKDGVACCAAECGRCGGSNCGSLPGGSSSCCNGKIEGKGLPCAQNPPPCVVGGHTLPPAPPGAVCKTAALARGAAPAAARAGAQPPHIIHIMADDTGNNDLGYRNGLVCSPNLDALATGGVQVTSHYAFKVCAPSRSSFHTGRYPFHMGYWDNSAKAVPWVEFDSDRMAVSLNFTLLPQLLQQKGYVSHAIGKWHLGHVAKAHTPTYRGYDSFLGYYAAMTEDYWEHTHSAVSGCEGPGTNGLWRDMSDSSGQQGAIGVCADNGTFESVLFGDRAVAIIEEHDTSKPLFMYMAFHNEHDPHQSPLDAVQRYPHLKTDTYRVTAALIETMDDEVGRIITALNHSGMLSNTVIGFSSDNGGPLDHANNAPLRGGKHTFWEGGLRTLSFVWSPLIPAARRGTEWSGMMHVADWWRTYAEGVAGAAIPADTGPFPGDSHNVWPALLAGAASPRTEVVHQVHSPAHYPGNCTIDTWKSRNCPAAIRVGELKLMLGVVGDNRVVPLDEAGGGGRFGDSGGTCAGARCKAPGYKGKGWSPSQEDPGGCLRGCLFNLTADVAEATNLYSAPEHAADVARLTARLTLLGADAPGWAQSDSPAVAALTDSALKSSLCDAAKRTGGVQPIDA